MSVRRLALMGNAVLRMQAKAVPRGEVTSAHVRKLIEDMAVTMKHNDGAGLAGTMRTRMRTGERARMMHD